MLKQYWESKVYVIFVCFMLCIFAPLEIYLSNDHFFWFGPSDLLPYLMIGFIISTIVGMFFFSYS